MQGIDAYDVLAAAARQQVGQLPPEELPMLAAEWLAAGLDTPTLRELAALSRGDRSAAGLWPDVLAELGIALPVLDPRRVLAPWAARLVLDGERDAGWLVQQLLRDIPFDDVDDLVSLLYGLDHCLETIERPYARRVREVAGVLVEAGQRLTASSGCWPGSILVTTSDRCPGSAGTACWWRPRPGP